MKNSRLSMALIEAGIRPLDPDAVDTCQRKMVDAHPPSFWWKISGAIGYVLPFIPLIGVGIGILGIAATILGGIGLGVFWMLHTSIVVTVGELVSSFLWTNGLLVTLAGTCLCIAGFLAGYASENIMVRGPAEWLRHPLDNYENAGRRIPEDVRAKVIAIGQSCPGARFFVEELWQSKEPLDPFLIVCDKMNGERYIIHQWDEPLFAES